MAATNELVLNAFFYVVAPAMLASLFYMFGKLPQSVRDGIYRTVVVGLLAAIAAFLYLIWFDLREIPTRIIEAQIDFAEVESRAMLDAVQQKMNATDALYDRLRSLTESLR